MKTSQHDMITQLQQCAVELLGGELWVVPLKMVQELHTQRSGVAVNLDWIAERIEYQGILRLTMLGDGTHFVSIGEIPQNKT